MYKFSPHFPAFLCQFTPVILHAPFQFFLFPEPKHSNAVIRIPPSTTLHFVLST